MTHCRNQLQKWALNYLDHASASCWLLLFYAVYVLEIVLPFLHGTLTFQSVWARRFSDFLVVEVWFLCHPASHKHSVFVFFSVYSESHWSKLIDQIVNFLSAVNSMLEETPIGDVLLHVKKSCHKCTHHICICDKSNKIIRQHCNTLCVRS
jgi:hypothetical protein